MFQAIIFDFDGTILDSELPDYQAWQHIFQAHGAHLPLERWLTQIGTVDHTFDPYHLLETQIGHAVDRVGLQRQRRQHFLDLVAQEAIKPGVVELIEIAKQAGIQLGVASSGTRDWVEGHLTQRKLRQHFVVVRTSADVTRVKPDPELYLSALAALGVAPQHALAIEDSRNGMLAAKGAGMRCVVVPNSMTQGLDFGEADWVVESILDLCAWLQPG
jgi:HAD superfamily hydrolase (TIGR01509 family)